MKKTTKLVGGTLAFAIMALGTASAAFAYQGDPSVKSPDYSPERHEAMEQAFGENDYDSWSELMSDKGRVTQVIDADNFARFAEAHKLAEEGSLEESKNIRAELGLGLKDGSGQGKGLGNGDHSGRMNGNGQRVGAGNSFHNN